MKKMNVIFCNGKLLPKTILLIFVSVFVSCSEADTAADIQKVVEERIVTITGSLEAQPSQVNITSNPSEIISFNNVEDTFVKGDSLKLRINRDGVRVDEYDILFDGVYESNGERLVFCKTINGLVVGQGDSGSPVLDKNGKVIAILCYGFSFANHQFAARAIEDVQGVGSVQTSSEKSNFNKLNLSYSVSGLSNEEFMSYISKDSIGRFDAYKKAKIEEQNSISGKNVLSVKSTSQEEVIPGNSISLIELQGTYVNFYATGTASFVDESNIYGFGHSTSMSTGVPVYLSKMVTMIESEEIGYKLSLPTDVYLGKFIGNKQEGILIDKTAEEGNSVCSIFTSISIGNGEPVIDTHKSAKFEGDDYRTEYHVRNLPPFLVDQYMSAKFDNLYTYVKAEGVLSMIFDNGDKIELKFDSYEERGYDYYQVYDIYYYISSKIYTYLNSSSGVISEFSLDVTITDYKNTDE
ncbi:MAG: hypothetical protein P8L42_05190 [Flavicella sp.]|nr:hypothetical protein [Flavicella sp.]